VDCMRLQITPKRVIEIIRRINSSFTRTLYVVKLCIIIKCYHITRTRALRVHVRECLRYAFITALANFSVSLCRVVISASDEEGHSLGQCMEN